MAKYKKNNGHYWTPNGNHVYWTYAVINSSGDFHLGISKKKQSDVGNSDLWGTPLCILLIWSFAGCGFCLKRWIHCDSICGASIVGRSPWLLGQMSPLHLLEWCYGNWCRWLGVKVHYPQGINFSALLALYFIILHAALDLQLGG